MEPLVPSEGWGVVHLFYKVDRARAEAEPGGTKRVLDAIASLEADDHQVLVFTVLGHKAELGIMALGPDVARLQAFQHELAAAPLQLEWSYVSLTERSEYTEDEERARARLYPALPRKRAICFYPMSKRRAPDANWYELPFDQRKQLMGGHARVGRAYAGRVLQLITGSTGLDDWEWGVTLLADDPAALKEIVYDMRFDEVSARYAEFGPFVTGLLLDPGDALQRVGMPTG
ncbi:MAG TPA: chlorite dismutase family protein [Acidimicrobiia bacterium]|nr:chlorite dismutase family protein [Acidimicrobiia bacterium]